MCKVSVLVPVYNVKKYLKQCLDSLAAQTLDDIEFVCIDDGSTDGCSEILDGYAERDVRFRIIHKTNSGYGASMNLGLQAAHGTYIGILESDDFTAPEMYKALYDAAERSQVEIVRSNFYTFDDVHGERFHELLAGCPYDTVVSAQEDPHILQMEIYLWSSLYRKDFLQKYGIQFQETPGASYQDVSFCMKALSCCKRILLLKDAFVRYRMDNPESSIHKDGARKIKFFHHEFQAYWMFLRAQEEAAQQSGLAVAPYLWRHYTGLFYQTSDDAGRIGRILQLKEDFQSVEQDGFLSEKFWSKEDWGKLDALLHRTEEFLWNDTAEAQTRRLFREGLLRIMQQGTEAYLYGAGQVAANLLKVMKNCEVRVSGILVSDAGKNPEHLSGIPVYSLTGSPADPVHDLVIIAVTPRKPAVQQEIFAALVRAGYRNVIVLTKELQQVLR